MPIAGLLIGLGLALILAGCGQPEREWMKLNQPYTVEEFRRDLKECTRRGVVDEDCMKSRGWVSVAPPRAEKPPEPTMRQPDPRYR